jgi:hypothetical protein
MQKQKNNVFREMRTFRKNQKEILEKFRGFTPEMQNTQMACNIHMSRMKEKRTA